MTYAPVRGLASLEQRQRIAARAYVEGLFGWGAARADGYLAGNAAFDNVMQRLDASRSGQRRCVRGTACGGACIAPGKTCRIKGNPQKLARLKQLLALPAAGQTSSQGAGGARAKTGTKLTKEQSIALEVMSNKKLRSDKARKQEMIRRGIAPDTDFVELVATAKQAAGPQKGPYDDWASTSPKNKQTAPRESLPELKRAVLQRFGVKSVRELQNDKIFRLATERVKFNPSDRESWAKLHREFVGVPQSERNLPDGPRVIRGIDVTKNFRPWHVFNLDPKTATTKDVKKAFGKLALQHHPDHGGDPETFQALRRMRDSVMALMDRG